MFYFEAYDIGEETLYSSIDDYRVFCKSKKDKYIKKTEKKDYMWHLIATDNVSAANLHAMLHDLVEKKRTISLTAQHFGVYLECPGLKKLVRISGSKDMHEALARMRSSTTLEIYEKDFKTEFSNINDLVWTCVKIKARCVHGNGFKCLYLDENPVIINGGDEDMEYKFLTRRGSVEGVAKIHT